MKGVQLRIVLGGVCIVVLCSSAYAWIVYTHADEAQTIVAACTREKNPESCYETKVPNLYPALSIPKIFDVVRQIRQLDPSYQFCHVLAHRLGEDAVLRDPSHWLDLIPLNPPDGLCSNGFIHGVIIGRFRNDVLDSTMLKKAMPDFARACEPRQNWSPSSLDQAICYHGMGHLFMFITNANIRTSLQACDAIGISPTGDFTRVCREGVFMQIYQPLEPDDFALLEHLPEKSTAQNYRRLCATYAAPAQGACLREAWPLFRDSILNGTGVAAFCSGQPNAEQENACYESVSAIIGRLSLGQEDKAGNACDNFPEKRQATCFESVAQAIIEEDRTNTEPAIAVCERAQGSVAETCLATLASHAEWIFLPDSAGLQRFCAALPGYKEECLGGH